MTYLWSLTFTTLRPMASLPRLLCVASERRSGPDYHCEGRYRQSERHCLFEYTLSGEGRFQDSSGSYRVPPGYGFLCEISDPSVEYFQPAEAKEPWEFVFTCFEGPAATATVRELIGRHGPLYKMNRDNHAIQRLLALQGVGHETKEGSAGEGAAPICELLAALDATASSPGPSGNAAGEIIRKAKILIEESLPRGISIGELATAMEISREHLSRSFIQQTDTTLHDYITRRRMLCACRLLKDGGMSAGEVGETVGIRLPQHFTRLFKRTIKMTPMQFRRYGGIPEF